VETQGVEKRVLILLPCVIEREASGLRKNFVGGGKEGQKAHQKNKGKLPYDWENKKIVWSYRTKSRKRYRKRGLQDAHWTQRNRTEVFPDWITEQWPKH